MLSKLKGNREPDTVREFRGLARQVVVILADVEAHLVIPVESLGAYVDAHHQLRDVVGSGSWNEETILSKGEKLAPIVEAALRAVGPLEDPFFANVADPQIKAILTRDLEEAQDCLCRGLYKSCVLLSGSILETVLYELLRRNPAWTMDAMRPAAPKRKGGVPKDIKSTAEEDGWKLAELIKFAAANGLLHPQDEDHLGRVLRDPRNLIHPMAELRGDSVISGDQAAAAYHSLRVVLGKLSAKKSIP